MNSGRAKSASNMVGSRHSQRKHPRRQKTLKGNTQPDLSALHRTRHIQRFNYSKSEQKPQHRQFIKKSQAVKGAVSGAASDEPTSQAENADMRRRFRPLLNRRPHQWPPDPTPSMQSRWQAMGITPNPGRWWVEADGDMGLQGPFATL